MQWLILELEPIVEVVLVICSEEQRSVASGMRWSYTLDAISGHIMRRHGERVKPAERAHLRRQRLPLQNNLGAA